MERRLYRESNSRRIGAAAWAICKRWMVGAALSVVLAPAVQAQQVFFEDFGACTSSGPTTVVNSAVALVPPITVRVSYTPGNLVCSGWTFSGRAYLAEYVSGSPFPGAATQAVWLNEGPQGRMNRAVSGLVVGHTYRVSAQAWTDDVDAPTALGLDFGSVTTSLAMAAGSGPQNISAEVCATSSDVNLSLYENGATASSPVVTNVTLEDLDSPCLIPGYYTVGGSVTGLAAGNSVILLNNGGNALTVNADGTFTFTASMADTAAYAATVGTQPNGQVCTVTQGTGTVPGANVTNILVTCDAAVVPGVIPAVPVPVSAAWMLAMLSALIVLFASLVRRSHR